MMRSSKCGVLNWITRRYLDFEDLHALILSLPLDNQLQAISILLSFDRHIPWNTTPQSHPQHQGPNSLNQSLQLLTVSTYRDLYWSRPNGGR